MYNLQLSAQSKIKLNHLLMVDPDTGSDTGKQYIMVINGAKRKVITFATHPKKPRFTALVFGRADSKRPYQSSNAAGKA